MVYIGEANQKSKPTYDNNYNIILSRFETFKYIIIEFIF